MAQNASEEGMPAPRPKLSEHDFLNRGYALLGQTDVLPQVGRMSRKYVTDLQMQHLKDNRNLLLNMLRNARSQPAQALKQLASKMTQFAGLLYELALARSGWSRQRADVYLIRINILSFHQYFRSDSRNNHILAGHAFDIVANKPTLAPSSSMNPFLARMEQGVLDTNAEALLLSETNHARNAANLFAASMAQGIDWVVIQEVNDPVFEKTTLPDDIRARIRKDLAAGHAVMVPSSGVWIGDQQEFGWWRVVPGKGVVLGIGSRGWGQTASEWPLVAGLAAWMVSLVSCVTATGHMSGQPLLYDCLLCSSILGIYVGTAVAGGVTLVMLAQIGNATRLACMPVAYR